VDAKGFKVDQALVKHVARLAQLEVGPDEVVQLERDLGKIIDYFGALNASATSPEAHGVVSRRALPRRERDDSVQPSLSAEAAVSQAAHQQTLFRVPRVIE
jgi:aspartyl/glutamyl-tRNA(Asn/Gln) amidotransferase C subunit